MICWFQALLLLLLLPLVLLPLLLPLLTRCYHTLSRHLPAGTRVNSHISTSASWSLDWDANPGSAGAASDWSVCLNLSFFKCFFLWNLRFKHLNASLEWLEGSDPGGCAADRGWDQCQRSGLASLLLPSWPGSPGADWLKCMHDGQLDSSSSRFDSSFWKQWKVTSG